jgi:hypothetical protein
MSLLAVPVAAALGPLLPREAESKLPAYWPLRHLLTWLLVAVPAVVLLSLLLRRGTALSGRGWRGPALVVALATPVFPYATLFFGHLTGGLLAAIATLLLLRPEQADPLPSPKTAALAGLLLALAVTIDYPIALFGLVLLFTLWLRRAPGRTVAAFVAAGVLGTLPCLLYHQLAFGSPIATGYAFKADDWHAIIHSTGVLGITWPTPERLWGVLLGAKRGVIYYCPMLVLVPLGLRQMSRHRRGSALPYGLLLVLCISCAAGFVDWQAGWSAAARHLLPGFCVSLVPLVIGLHALASHARWSWIAPLLIGASLAGAWLSVALTPFFPEHFSAPLSQLVLPSLLSGHAAPTLFSAAGSSGGWMVVCAAGLVALVLVFWGTVQLAGIPASRFRVLALLVGGAALYVCAISLAESPNEEQIQMQAEVLRRIGYP